MTKLQTLLKETIKKLNAVQHEKTVLKRRFGKVNADSLMLKGKVELLHELISDEAIEKDA